MSNTSSDTQYPPLPTLPVSEIVLISFSWISFLVFIYLIVVILRKRNEYQPFKESFFLIILFNSIGELLLIVYVEIFVRPRKYRFWNIFTDRTPISFAVYSTFVLVSLKNFICLSYLPLSVNIFSAVIKPMTYKYFWTETTVLVSSLLVWTLSIGTAIPIFFLDPTIFKFKYSDEGILGLSGLHLVSAAGSLIHIVLVCVICMPLFVVASVIIINNSQNSQEVQKVFVPWLIYAVLTFIPLCLEMLRSSILIYATWTGLMGSTLLIMADLCACTLSILPCLQCWTLIATSAAVRSYLKESIGIKKTTRVQRVTTTANKFTMT